MQYTMHVNPKANYSARSGSARAAWYAVITTYHGKPLADFIAAVQAAPPSTPTKGKLAGQLEPPMGWVRHFVKAGVVALVPVPPAAAAAKAPAKGKGKGRPAA